MAHDRALVRNAADPKQVKDAKKRETLQRDNELADLRAVLNTLEGRRVLWRILEHTKTFGSIYDESPNRIAFNSGRQDVGHFVMAEINDADASKILTMMQESQARERQRNTVIDAEAENDRATTEEPEEKPDADS